MSENFFRSSVGYPYVIWRSHLDYLFSLAGLFAGRRTSFLMLWIE